MYKKSIINLLHSMNNTCSSIIIYVRLSLFFYCILLYLYFLLMLSLNFEKKKDCYWKICRPNVLFKYKIVRFHINSIFDSLKDNFVKKKRYEQKVRYLVVNFEVTFI